MLYITGGNKKLWNEVGVRHSHATVLKNIPMQHPFDSTRSLEFLPDSVHVFKSMIHGWINNKTIELPDYFVQNNGLTCSIVDVKHLTDLVQFEIGCDLKMASGLNREDVDFAKPL